MVRVNLSQRRWLLVSLERAVRHYKTRVIHYQRIRPVRPCQGVYNRAPLDLARGRSKLRCVTSDIRRVGGEIVRRRVEVEVEGALLWIDV